jgi:hypothetical protein
MSASRKNAQSAFGDTQFEQVTLTTADFNGSQYEDTSLSAGNVGELMTSEVEEDGQLASYDAVRLGQNLGPTGQSAQGKLFVDLQDSNGNAVDDRTQIRVVARPKNGNSRKEIVGWQTIRDLDRDDPRQRLPLPPVTNANGEAQIVGSGRIIAVEIRNPATSISVDREKSSIILPARAGY